MMNFGDLKKYLRDGKRREDMIGVPRWEKTKSKGEVEERKVKPSLRSDGDDDSPAGSNQLPVADEDKKKLAKTFMKVSLSKHDLMYHKGGYKDGDDCNFREALKHGDSADELAAAEKKEGDVKVGFVTFKEDPKTGKKQIVGVEEAEKVEVKGKGEKTVEVAGIGGEKDIQRSADGGRTAEDRLPTSLAEHDARFHPNGYKDGDDCKVRKEMGRGDSADLGASAEEEERGRGRKSDGKHRMVKRNEKVASSPDGDDAAAYEILARPIYLGRFKDGTPVKEGDLPRLRTMLDKFMLKHPEIAALNEDAAYDLENAVGRNPGWHRNDAQADVARAWCDDDVDALAEELTDTPNGATRDLFECFYPESHFNDEQAEIEREEAYQKAVKLSVGWALHDKPSVWADEKTVKGWDKGEGQGQEWNVTLSNGSAVDMMALADEVKSLIGAAADQVARGNDPVERYLAATR